MGDMEVYIILRPFAYTRGSLSGEEWIINPSFCVFCDMTWCGCLPDLLILNYRDYDIFLCIIPVSANELYKCNPDISE